MSEQGTKLLPHPKEEAPQGDMNARRQMNNSHLPPFGMPSGPRSFANAPSTFDGKQEGAHNHMMSKFPPNNSSGANASMSAPGQHQQQHEYPQQQGPGPSQSGGPQYNMGNQALAFWPGPQHGQPNAGQVPFPNQRDPSHLPSPLYGGNNNLQPQNYASYPPRPTSGSSMPRTGSPHTEVGSTPLPPPQQMHEGYSAGQQQQQQQQQHQQQQAGNNPGGYMGYAYGNPQSGPQGAAASMYGGPTGYGGGYPQQQYGGAAPGQAAGPNANGYGSSAMYGHPMPHSREGSQDAAQWQRSPYGPGPAYPGSYGPPYNGSTMPAQQSPYSGGRAGRGASNTGERPFKCDQCPQSFQRSHDLKRHKRIHLAIKPFPCPSCDKSFSRKDALKRHILVKGCGNTSS